LKINIHYNNSIQKIDRKNNTIIDANGNLHSYDQLILATGSSPFIPTDVHLDLPGRFTMRNKTDADRFKDYLEQTNLPPEQQHVVIVGGGLLGLELAAALKQKDLKVTIIQRSSRLMERQLDKVSSKLLALDVQERGIQV